MTPDQRMRVAAGAETDGMRNRAMRIVMSLDDDEFERLVNRIERPGRNKTERIVRLLALVAMRIVSDDAIDAIEMEEQ